MRRRNVKLVLLRTLRGEGMLLGKGVKRPVTYEVSLFEQGEDHWGQGSITGELGPLVAGGDTAALSLRLAGGQEVPVQLSDIDEEGATLEFAAPAAILAGP